VSAGVNRSKKAVDNASVPAHVLLVLGDQMTTDLFARGLEAEDLRVTVTSDPAAALDVYTRERPDVVVCDEAALGLQGIELLRQIRSIDRDASVVLVGGHAPLPRVVEVMKHGAADYPFHPLTTGALRAAVNPLVQRSPAMIAAGSAAR